MSDQNQRPVILDEKAGVSSPPTILEDKMKEDTVVVMSEEENKLLKKIDLQ
jgi:hypothetical protein